MGEWRAFERHYGPLLIHERIDWGFAALLAALSGGGPIADHLPPWHRRSDEVTEVDEGFMVSRLRGLAAKSKPKGV